MFNSVFSFTWRNKKDIIPPWFDDPNLQYFAAPLVNDFNSDNNADILIPICREKECKHVDKFTVWSHASNKWELFQLDMKVRILSYLVYNNFSSLGRGTHS